MELWTNAQVAKHLGVSESRARAILARHHIERVTGYPADAVRAIHRPGQGARTDLKGSTMQRYRGYAIVEHTGSEVHPHFHTQFVRDGDKALIPSDCGGGFETVEEAQAVIDSIPPGY